MLPDQLKNNPFFDPAAADREVIDSLWRTIRRLDKMPKLLRLIDGRVVRVVGEIEDVSQDELQAIHDELLREADNVNAFIEKPAEEAPAADEPAAPAEDVPAAPEQPAAPEAPVDAAPAVPEAPAAPVDAPAPAAEPVAEQPAAPAPEAVPAPQVTVTEAAPVAPAEPAQPTETPVIQ